MAGSISNPKRPRYQDNERFDTSDADAQSRATREQDKASMRAVHSTPRNTAGSPSTIGMILTGFELTLNPTNGTDGKVRVSSNVGVALDSDGGVLVKPQGTTVDITIPVGTYQIYAYYSEISTDNAKRRFLSVTSPFVESSRNIDTSFQGQCSFTTIAGNAASVVAEAVVSGVTTPLCCIGIATNAGGAITMTGYNAVSAPNGTDIVNRLSVPVLPTTLPTTPYVNGSMRSVTDVLQALAYMMGQAFWRNSAVSPPTLANNFQAWNPHTSSIATLAEYLAAGNFVGPSTFNNTLSVTGLLTALAGIAVPTGQHVTLAGSTDLIVGTGGITNNGPQTTTGLITANAGVTAAANQHITVSGSGAFKHGTFTRIIPATAGSPFGSGMTWSVDNTGGPISYAAAALARWFIPIELDVGERILTVRGIVLDSATGPTTITMSVRKLISGTETLLSSAVTSAGSGVYQTLPVSTINEVVALGAVYYAAFTEPTGSATIKIQGIEVDHDRP